MRSGCRSRLLPVGGSHEETDARERVSGIVAGPLRRLHVLRGSLRLNERQWLCPHMPTRGMGGIRDDPAFLFVVMRVRQSFLTNP